MLMLIIILNVIVWKFDGKKLKAKIDDVIHRCCCNKKGKWLLFFIIIPPRRQRLIRVKEKKRGGMEGTSIWVIRIDELELMKLKLLVPSSSTVHQGLCAPPNEINDRI